MAKSRKNFCSGVLADARARLPPDKAVAQEAFAPECNRPLIRRVDELEPGVFYWFDEMVATALFDAAIEHAVRVGERLTVGYTSADQLQAHCHRLQRVAARLRLIRVLVCGEAGRELRRSARLECYNTSRSPLAAYRIALVEGSRPLGFFVRERRIARSLRCLGFLSADADVVEQLADDVEAVLRGESRRLATFEQLESLHQTMQRVAVELDNYARRLKCDIERVRRCPQLLTPSRFERIVLQALRKMEQLKEIPRKAFAGLSRRC
ncbi:MAG: hypothetical protein N3B01_06995 [Verrucomicrobiae bacterium]|nr:hypothetical protein [Verrucomicrobiae bacterium]